MKLYELTAAYAYLNQNAEDGEDDTQFLASLDALTDALQEKATGIAKVIENIEATADSIRQAEKRMADRRKVLERRSQSIRKYLLDNMIAGKIERIECPEFVLRVRENPVSLVIENLVKVPAKYMRQPPPEPDKRAMLDDLKQGVIIDGVSTTKTKRLEIK